MTYIKNITDMRQAKEHEELGIYFLIKKKNAEDAFHFQTKKSHSTKGSSGIVSADVNRHKKGHSLVKRKKSQCINCWSVLDQRWKRKELELKLI